MSQQQDEQQTQLPFAEAEGTYAERKALLWVALREYRARGHLFRFCEWLFDATAGGLGEPVVVSYSELVMKPWLMNCSKSTLRRTVAKAISVGLVTVEETVDSTGRLTGNRYALNQQTIGRMVTRFANRPLGAVQDEQVRVQNEPQNEQVRVQGEQVRAQDDHAQRGIDAVPSPRSLIPAGETPRTRANEPMTNEPMKEAQASEPTPMEESLVSLESAGAGRAELRAEPAHASRSVADVMGSLPTPEQYAARRSALKARIARAIADPDCHDSLAGRAADLVVLHGVPIGQVDAILDSLTAARRRGRINTTPGAWANGAFRRLAHDSGLDWGKADDG
jgi:hypothetical protein